ncbi:MAG: hypothetical protein ACRC18_06815 [Cetobacterium sp.]
MYRIVYKNDEISLYDGDKWIMTNDSKKDFVTVRSTLEAVLKSMNIKFVVEFR